VPLEQLFLLPIAVDSRFTPVAALCATPRYIGNWPIAALAALQRRTGDLGELIR
jgi:hypothetical protein